MLGRIMNDEEVMLHLFKLSHGEMTGSCSAKAFEDSDGCFIYVACMKDGGVCWTASREELMFDHLVRGMNETQS
jgi:hypothetical protein